MRRIAVQATPALRRSQDDFLQRRHYDLQCPWWYDSPLNYNGPPLLQLLITAQPVFELQ